jgi:serine protease AprX
MARACGRTLAACAVMLFAFAPLHLAAQGGGDASGVSLRADAVTPAHRAYWVFFTDKGPDAPQQLAEAIPAALGLSDAALARRAAVASARGERRDEQGGSADLRVLREAGLLTVEDLPIHPSYVQRVIATGAVVRATSRWLNAVSVSCDAATLARLRALPCVAELRPVARRRVRRDVETSEPVFPGLWKRTAGLSLSYGDSRLQLDPINVPRVHDVWIDGTGITIGMLDNGFRWRTHEAMQNINVRAEYDFINRDSVTQNEANDVPGQDGHGTLTFSALAGWLPGVLYGPAFRAAYYLGKTEANASETQIEEDWYAEGIEWLERMGSSITSTSLGYLDWDDGSGYSYDNGDFDGQTAVTTRAVARAARLGVVCVTAMGNEGNRIGTLIAPADADSIISVGATTFAGATASFSSGGPTNDGRIKPDVMAPGVGVFSAANYGDAQYTRSNGTSLATPLAAGVAALVRSARPELTPLQVRDALRETASGATSPNPLSGWGVVDAWKALLHHGMVLSTNPKVLWDGRQNLIAIWVVSPHAVDTRSVRLTWAVGRGPDQTMDMSYMRPVEGHPANGSGLYIATLPDLGTGGEVRYFVQASDAREQRTSPFGASGTRHRFVLGESQAEGAEDLLPKAFALDTPFPNPLCACASALVRYAVPVPGASVRLEVHDMLGRRVAVPVDGMMSAGVRTAVISGAALGSGAYTISLTSGSTQLVRPFIVVK